MNKKGISALKVAATYIGTVVGAGFATGQELLQFFSKFGAMGLAGLLISTSTVAALMPSQFGFSNLVKYWYPVEGYCGIILLVCLAYTTFSK